MVVLKELIFNSFCFGEGVVVLKELIFNSFYLGGCGGLERTDFNSQSSTLDFKKLNHSSSINFTCQKINNEYSCNYIHIILPSFFLPFW